MKVNVKVRVTSRVPLPLSPVKEENIQALVEGLQKHNYFANYNTDPVAFKSMMRHRKQLETLAEATAGMSSEQKRTFNEEVRRWVRTFQRKSYNPETYDCVRAQVKAILRHQE